MTSAKSMMDDGHEARRWAFPAPRRRRQLSGDSGLVVKRRANHANTFQTRTLRALMPGSTPLRCHRPHALSKNDFDCKTREVIKHLTNRGGSSETQAEGPSTGDALCVDSLVRGSINDSRLMPV